MWRRSRGAALSAATDAVRHVTNDRRDRLGAGETQPSPAVWATNSATSLVCSSLRMPPGIRPGVVELSTPFSTALRTRPSVDSIVVAAGSVRGPVRGEQFVEVRGRSCRRCRPRRACGRCRSWSGTATGRSSGWRRPSGRRSRRRPWSGRPARGSTTARTTTSSPKTMKVRLLIECLAPVLEVDPAGRRRGYYWRPALARYHGHIRRSAHSSQRGFGRQSVAPVPDQVHVQLVGVLGVDDRQHLVVGALEGGLGREQAEPAADPVDVDVDRDLGDAPGEDQHAGRGFAPDAGQREQELERLLARRRLGPVEVRGLAEQLEDRLDPRRLLLAPGRRAGSPPRARRAARRGPPPRWGSAPAARAKARSRLRSLVCWESTVLISSRDRVAVRLVEPAARTSPAAGRGSPARGVCRVVSRPSRLTLDGLAGMVLADERSGSRRRSCGSTGCGSSTAGSPARAPRPSTATATRPTARTGCRSSSAAVRRWRSTCRAGGGRTDPTRRASTTRWTGSRPSSSAASTSSEWGSASLSSTTGASLALIGAQRQPQLARASGRRSTRCRCCPATAGTGSPSSGAAARSASSSTRPRPSPRWRC